MWKAKGAGSSCEYDGAMCRRKARAYIRCLPLENGAYYLEWANDGPALQFSARTGESSS